MKTKETVLVLGASDNPGRYSHIACLMLLSYGHIVVPVGKKQGFIGDMFILREVPAELKPDTITLYLNPVHQETYFDLILGLKPVRVIFNPGTENPVFEEMLQNAAISAQTACTLVLLRTGQF
ncbi:MAG: CoA-binding protein [Bacteroidetes bacterium]|nr:CoA-binding protein [Bacteroidota bacterium]